MGLTLTYNNHKLNFRSEQRVFIDYSSHHKGYLSLIHGQYVRIYVSRHVKFDELTFPFLSNPKRNVDGVVHKHKAKLVAKGFHQQEDFHYLETFSPVVKAATNHIVPSLAISRD
ncbi:putative mitochondrial protein, partial [Mucuna pruriens]